MLIDITSIKPFQFDYVTKLLALVKQIDDMEMTLSLQVESKLAMASLRELKGAPKQFEDPAEFCEIVFEDYLKKEEPEWLKPIDAFFFLDAVMQLSARLFFNEYFGEAVDKTRRKLPRSSVAFNAFGEELDPSTINKASRLAKLRERSFGFEREHPYHYYASQMLRAAGEAALAPYADDPNKAIIDLLKLTNHPLAEHFYVDGEHANLFALAWKNILLEKRSLASVDLKVFEKVADFSRLEPRIQKVWNGYKRGAFPRLIWHALDDDDRFDIAALEFDKGFCSLLAFAVDDVESYPEPFQIEYFRMCHYVGLSVDTDLYCFNARCDYTTYEHRDVPTLLEVADLGESILISENPFIVYRVSFYFDNEMVLERLPITLSNVGHFNLG